MAKKKKNIPKKVKSKPIPKKKPSTKSSLKGRLKVSTKKISGAVSQQERQLAKEKENSAKILGKVFDITGSPARKHGKKGKGKKTTAYVKKAYYYKNPYLSDNKKFKKKHLRKVDIAELKRQRKNLQNTKSRIKLSLDKSNFQKNKKNKLTKTQINRLRKKLLHATVAIREINNRLGIVTVVQKAPRRKTYKKKQKVKVGKKLVSKETEKDIVAVWLSRDKLTEILKEGKMKYYVINGEKYSKNKQPEIFLGMAQLEDRVFSSGISTPYVLFYQRVTDKIVEITEFYEETEE